MYRKNWCIKKANHLALSERLWTNKKSTQGVTNISEIYTKKTPVRTV